MNSKDFSEVIDLKQVKVTDDFWKRTQELVRSEVLPYQWEALHDRIEGAAPSWCIHNFQAAAEKMRSPQKSTGKGWAGSRTFRGFEILPKNGEAEPDAFYGFVFQDTDLYKWIEAAAYTLTWQADADLETRCDEAIDFICAAQAENGYLDTCYILGGMDRAFTNLRDHHELYCLGHLVEAAVAYFEATGKEKLLTAARRFADYVAEYFGPNENQCHGYPGHEIAEMALVRLYHCTGEEKYLRLAAYFLDERGKEPPYFEEEAKRRALWEKEQETGEKAELSDIDPAEYIDPDHYIYLQAHAPVRNQDEAVGHAVRAGYLYSGMADVARLHEDETLYQACRKLWESIAETKLYVTGGMGGTVQGEAFSAPYDLRNDQAYSETCAAISLVFFARRMLQIHADSEYADVMERALYNTVLAGMALDGKSFFYVNPLEVVPENCRKDGRLFHVKPVRQKWFGCACCPPNLARLVASVADYAYTESEDTVYIHLYMGTEYRTNINDRPFILKMQTSLPWEGEVCLELKAGTNRKLALRMPGWSKQTRIEVAHDGQKYTLLYDGKTIRSQDPVARDGYLYLDVDWQDGDQVNLSFDMSVHMLQADGRVRADAGQVAFMRGPLVYCMEEADNGKNLHLCRVDLKKTGDSCAGAEVTEGSICGQSMRFLQVPGLRLAADFSTDLYRDYQPPVWEECNLTLIPYYAWANRGEGEMRVWVRT